MSDERTIVPLSTHIPTTNPANQDKNSVCNSAGIKSLVKILRLRMVQSLAESLSPRCNDFLRYVGGD